MKAAARPAHRWARRSRSNFVKDTNLAYLGGSTFKVGGLDVEATTANQTFAFNPASAVNTTKNTINLGVTSLVTGDSITYDTNGGTAIGGLTNGTEYFVNVQADGTVALYDNYTDAVAGGTTGLMTLTSGGTGNATMVNDSDDFNASATSGAGGGDTGVAGSLAINITIADTEADLGYTQPNSSPGVPNITVTGGGNVTLNAQTASVVTASAVPADGGGSGANLGVGISLALDYSQTSTLAQITNNVVLNGANNLSMTATSTQDMTTTTRGGASGSTGVTPVIAIAITDNDTDATLGTGGQISLTGSFSATASLTDQVENSASGATQSSGTGVGITVTVTVVNDNSLATTGRNLKTTDATAANGTIAFSATTLSSSQSTAIASVAGGQQDDGSGQHSDSNSNDQTVDNTTKTQSSYGDSEVKGADSSAKGTEGSDSNNKAQSSNGSVSVAGAVAVNVEDGTAEAYIPDGLSVSATGLLSVVTAAQVNGQAIASGAATTSSGGTGVGVGVSVNVANETNEAYIGNNTVISSGGLMVQAGMAQRSVALATTSVPVVDTSANTIFLGLGTGLTTGTEVTYHTNGGTAIGDLTDGSNYYVNSQGNGTFTLYDSATDAMAGGSTGLEKLTSTAGAGTSQNFTQSLFGLITTNTITFDPTGNVTLLNLGNYGDLHTGDVVTYNSGGGSAMGGLVNGGTYYVIDLTGGNFQLASSLDNAVSRYCYHVGAAGSSPSSQSLVDNTDNFRADATSACQRRGYWRFGFARRQCRQQHDQRQRRRQRCFGGAECDHYRRRRGQRDRRRATSKTLPARFPPQAAPVAAVSAWAARSALTWSATRPPRHHRRHDLGRFGRRRDRDGDVVRHGVHAWRERRLRRQRRVGIGAAVSVCQRHDDCVCRNRFARSRRRQRDSSPRATPALSKTRRMRTPPAAAWPVGASVSVDVVEENVTAQTARSITTTSGTMSIEATTSVEDQTWRRRVRAASCLGFATEQQWPEPAPTARPTSR